MQVILAITRDTRHTHGTHLSCPEVVCNEALVVPVRQLRLRLAVEVQGPGDCKRVLALAEERHE